MRVEIDISPQFNRGKEIYLGMGGDVFDCICLNPKEYKLLLELTQLKENKRSRGKSKGRNKTRQKIRVYTIMCFLLLKPHLNRITHIDIDRDFKGHHNTISDKLFSLISQEGFECDWLQIYAEAEAGKGNAHEVASYFRTGNMGQKVSKRDEKKIKSVAVRKLSAEEIFNYY